MKKIVLAVCVLIWPVITLAEDAFNNETKKAVRVSYELYGGYITDLGIDAEGRMYASTLSSNGIFHSSDSVTTWTGPVAGTDLGKVNALAISDEPDTAYVIGGIKLYKTTDGGDTWTAVTGSSGDAEASDYNLALAYANGVLVAPVRDGTLDISTNEGESFTNVTIADGVSTDSIVGSPDGATFYIMASGSGDNQNRTLYVLDVASSTVTATSQSGNYAWVRVKPTDANFIVIAGADGALYTTTGAAGTWQTLTTQPITGEINFVGDRIYLGDKYTDNLGGTVNSLVVNASHLAVDPNDSTMVVIGSGTGVYTSTDGGDTWSEDALSEGLLGVTVNDIAQSENKKIVWLAAQGGLARSSNFLSDSPTWEYPILPDQASSDMDCVWVNPNDASHVLAGASNLYFSMDGGDTWEVANGVNSLTGAFTSIVADGTTLYAGFSEQQGDGTVYTSTDAGQSWTDLGGLDAPVNDLAVLNDGTVVAGTGYEFSDEASQHGVFLYDGSTWEQISTGIDQSVMSIDVVGETIFAAGIGDPDGKLLRSQDNGATWEDITDSGLPSAAYFHSVTAADATTIYAATGRPAGTSYVYKSTDGGDTWYLLYTGLVDEEFNDMLFDGLTTGTTIGLQSLFSKANLTISAKGSRLSIVLKDAATADQLNKRTLKLYKRTKKTGAWTAVKLKTKRTNNKGKLTIDLTQSKTTYYQVRWSPNDIDAATYGTNTTKSKQLKVSGAR